LLSKNGTSITTAGETQDVDLINVIIQRCHEMDALSY
jgi:hypothetical protein